MSSEGYRALFLIYLKGLAMGSADAIPGVSGGTIALITGIYERLLDALTAVTFTRIRRFFKCLFNRDISGLNKILEELDFSFLAALSIGIGTAIVIVLNFIHTLLMNYPVPTYGFFFGLIAVSAVVLFSEVDIHPAGAKISAITGFSLAFIASGVGATALGHEMAAIFLAGMLAVTAMVLPGISGSLILVILGQYEYITGALSRFTDAVIGLFKTGNVQHVLETSVPIVVFCTGAAVGLFSIVHIVERALENFRNLTMAFLVSMVIGALRAPVLQVGEHLSKNSLPWTGAVPEFAAAAVFGGALIFVLDRRTEAI